MSELLERDDSLFTKIKETIKSVLHETAFPNEALKALQKTYYRPVGLMVLLSFSAIFLGIFLPGYLAQISTIFLAPLDNSG
jgi:hypothetical protein